MTEDWEKKGYLSPEEVKFPSKDKLKEGKQAIIECPQRIPCDPCREVCPTGAITMETINSIPKLDRGKCSGCGVCIRNCPGLAIYLLGLDEDRAEITLPFEFEPLPEIGQKVEVKDRAGDRLCEGTVLEVEPALNPREDTSIIKVAFPEEYVFQARWVRRLK